MMTFGLTQSVMAQEEAAASTEVVDSAAVDSAAVQEAPVAEEAPAVVEETEGGIHKELKTKFIEAIPT